MDLDEFIGHLGLTLNPKQLAYLHQEAGLPSDWMHMASAQEWTRTDKYRREGRTTALSVKYLWDAFNTGQPVEVRDHTGMLQMVPQIQDLIRRHVEALLSRGVRFEYEFRNRGTVYLRVMQPATPAPRPNYPTVYDMLF